MVTSDLQEKYGEHPKCDRIIARQDKLIPSALNQFSVSNYSSSAENKKA